ncbi:MAG: helix-turn-helix domain-containing protein [Chloroflexi bacterium]|nr:helix-turn-helix domain-containing protein [Chloroflexota bacterium]
MDNKDKKRWGAPQVQALRRHLGQTQQQMAQELGVRQQTVSEWETGLYEPRGASRTLLNLIAERVRFAYEADPSSPGASEVGGSPRKGEEGGEVQQLR